MIIKSSTPRESERLHKSQIAELMQTLKNGDYRTLALLLQDAQTMVADSEHGASVPLLRAAEQICVLLSLCNNEADWHRNASAAIAERETAFREQLYLLLKYCAEIMTQPSLSQPVADTAIHTRDGAHGLFALPALFMARRQRVSAPSVRVPPAPIPVQTPGQPDLLVCTLGNFEVFCAEQPVRNWYGRKSAGVFKFLLMHRGRGVHREELMDVFWADSTLDEGRNSLNVAIHNARKALRRDDSSISHIVFEDDCYCFNPDLHIWVDYEAFLERCKAAQLSERHGDTETAIAHYREAELIYRGTFLPESIYEDWTVELRERLQTAYLSALDKLSQHALEIGDYPGCISVSNKMIGIVPTCEQAHVRLMRCYSRQGQPYLAQRQFAQFGKALEEDATEPSRETLALMADIRAGSRV
ncbi:MAG: BTAD domain-containing putative transcriptional regulator [Chloroflexota bacterium]|nr:BTAD domain-containing putative transcriptional regulator [Chloroflexota bacterium]